MVPVGCRGGAPRGRARLRHWRAGTPSQGVPAWPLSASQTGRDFHASGAAIRTSALAALRSLTGARGNEREARIRGRTAKPPN